MFLLFRPRARGHSCQAGSRLVALGVWVATEQRGCRGEEGLAGSGGLWTTLTVRAVRLLRLAGWEHGASAPPGALAQTRGRSTVGGSHLSTRL